MSNIPNKTKIEEILEKINQYKKDIQNYLLEIQNTSDLEQQKDLYMKILNIDNTNETYVVNYLLCQKKLLDLNKISKENYINEVKKYHICISCEKYNEHFKKLTGKFLFKKFYLLLNLLKNF